MVYSSLEICVSAILQRRDRPPKEKKPCNGEAISWRRLHSMLLSDRQVVLEGATLNEGLARIRPSPALIHVIRLAV